MNQKTQPATAAPLVQAAQKKKHRITIQREIAVLLAMIVFNLLFTQHFWSLQTFNVNLTQVVTIVIVGIGMTLVVATGGIDLSVGASMAIAGALTSACPSCSARRSPWGRAPPRRGARARMP